LSVGVFELNIPAIFFYFISDFVSNGPPIAAGIVLLQPQGGPKQYEE
jgi:hypothetical protein